MPSLTTSTPPPAGARGHRSRQTPAPPLRRSRKFWGSRKFGGSRLREPALVMIPKTSLIVGQGADGPGPRRGLGRLAVGRVGPVLEHEPVGGRDGHARVPDAGREHLPRPAA